MKARNTDPKNAVYANRNLKSKALSSRPLQIFLCLDFFCLDYNQGIFDQLKNMTAMNIFNQLLSFLDLMR